MFNLFRRRDALLSGGHGSYVIFDLETTDKLGSGRPTPEIVEIACLEVDGEGTTLNSWETTLRPSRRSTPEALKTHRLNEALLADSPTFASIAPWLADYLNGKTLVSHNLHRFDAVILAAEFARISGFEVDLGTGIDTLPEAFKGFGLDRLRKEHQIDADAHTAMGDVLTVLELLQRRILVPPPARAPVRLRRGALPPADPPAFRPRRELYQSTPLDASGEDLSGWTLVSADPLVLAPGNKVCLTGGDGDVRSAMEQTHQRLALQSMRSFSKGHVAIVAADLATTSAKAQTARLAGKPFIHADDFIRAGDGTEIPTWTWRLQDS